MPAEFSVLLINAILVTLGYLYIYPAFDGKKFYKYFIISLVLLMAAVGTNAWLFSGRDLRFNALLFNTDWLTFSLISYFVIDSAVGFRYLKGMVKPAKPNAVNNPHQVLWARLLEASEQDDSLASMTEPERYYFLVSLMNGEINRNGLYHFFASPAADRYQDMMLALGAIEAFEVRALITEMADLLYPEREPPELQVTRVAERVPDSRTTEIIKHLYQQQRPLLFQKIHQYALEQRLIDPETH